MDVSDAKKMRALEDENRRLKHIVAELTLDIAAFKGVLGKKWRRPSQSGERRAS
jgi:putative transposase